SGKAYLVYVEEKQMHSDSAVITNGQFTFSGKVNKPTRATLAIYPFVAGVAQSRSPDIIDIYLENGEIAIIGTDSISNAVLSGTSLNLDQHKLNRALTQVAAKE